LRPLLVILAIALAGLMLGGASAWYVIERPQRFGAITVLPLTPRPGEAASRVLVRAIKGSRAPLTLLASRSLHDAQGRGFHADFDAIFRGSARLDW